MGDFAIAAGGDHATDRFGLARRFAPRVPAGAPAGSAGGGASCGPESGIGSPTPTMPSLWPRGVAHDLNNLLALILGHAEMALSEAAAGSGVRNALEQITHAADLGAALARDLLRSGCTRRHQLLPGGLNAVVRTALDIVRPLLNPAIQVQERLAPGLWAAAGDAAAIEQVVINLVENASEAMPRGGTLTVSTENVEAVSSSEFPVSSRGTRNPRRETRNGKSVCLTVADTGVGMDAATLSRLFEPYFTAKKNGTGLGLTMVERIVRQHGGRVSVASENGRGSAFRVFLPSTLASPGHIAPSA